MIRIEAEFGRRALHSPGHERVIHGSVLPRGERRIEIALIVDGTPRGGAQLRAEAAPIILKALEAVDRPDSGRDEPCGSFVDGRFNFEVFVGRHATGRAIYLRKTDDNAVQAGPLVAFHNEDIDALAAAVAWLVGSS